MDRRSRRISIGPHRPPPRRAARCPGCAPAGRLRGRPRLDLLGREPPDLLHLVDQKAELLAQRRVDEQDSRSAIDRSFDEVQAATQVDDRDQLASHADDAEDDAWGARHLGDGRRPEDLGELGDLDGVCLAGQANARYSMRLPASPARRAARLPALYLTSDGTFNFSRSRGSRGSAPRSARAPPRSARPRRARARRAGRRARSRRRSRALPSTTSPAP